jgi:hypothetical protein
MDVDTAVRVRLQEAGLNLSDEQIKSITKVYAYLREAADRLDIPEARYEEPTTTFRVSP